MSEGAGSPSASSASGQSAGNSTPQQAPTARATAQQSGHPAGASEGQQAAADYSKTKHKLKVNGREMELPYQEVIRRAQMFEGSQQRFDEASVKAQFADKVIAAFNAGDTKSLRELKEIDPKRFKTFAEDFLLEDMEEDRKPQWEKDLRDERKKREEAEKKLSEHEEGKKKDAYRRELAAASQRIDAEIGEVLQTMGRDASPYLIERIVTKMLSRYDVHGEHITAKQATDWAYTELDRDLGSYLGELSKQDVQAAMAKLPSELVAAIRNHDVERVVGKRPQRAPVRDSGALPQGQKGEAKMRFDDFFKTKRLG